jgi:hypothetical protein
MPIKTVCFEEQQVLLLEYSREVVDELFDFGSLVISEAQQRSAQLDSKLGTYLGYGAAIVALLSIGDWEALKHGPLALKMVMLISLALAMGAIIAVVIALKSEQWPVPSEIDWFKSKYIGDGDKLRRYHISALLKAHQEQQQNNETKANTMFVAELLIGVSGFCAAIALAIRILSSL